MNGKEEARAWFALLGGIPAIIAWVAYGLCWLLDPRIAGDQDPLQWAGYAAGGWYMIAAMIAFGPIIIAV